MTTDTIVAISTTLGESGIGIVRLSGPQALSIAEKLFIPKSGNKLSKANTFTVHYGSIVDPSDNSIIDEALVSVMLAPRTYTCEDVVELNCHGGIVPLRKALEAAWAVLPPDGLAPRLVLSSRHGEYARTEGLLSSLPPHPAATKNSKEHETTSEFFDSRLKVILTSSRVDHGPS